MVGSVSMEANNFINNENTSINVDLKSNGSVVNNNDKNVNVSYLGRIVSNIGCDNTNRVNFLSNQFPFDDDIKNSQDVPTPPINTSYDHVINDNRHKENTVKDIPRVQFDDSVEDIHHVQFEDSADDSDHKYLNEENHAIDDNYCISLNSSSSSDDADSDRYSEARAPDGGWGWVIVFASFMVNLIADGVTFSFGVIYLEFVKYFGEGKSKTAWIGSLFLAIPLLSGPIASYLTDRYGCRRVSIAGGILAAAGFVISAFINSIELLFFTFGILSGFGLSLCYVAAIVIVAYYFEKRRSFATGLSVCGSGIGTFIFPPFIDFLIDYYGWRSTTLILAGLFLNLCVCGALMRDLGYTKKKKTNRKLSGSKSYRNRIRTNTASSVDSSQYSQFPTPSMPSTEEIKRLLQVNGHENSIKEDTDLEPINELTGKNKKDKLFSSLVSLPTFVKNGEKVPLEVLEGLSTNRHLYAVLIHNYPSLLISSRSISDSGCINEQKRQRNVYSSTDTRKYPTKTLESELINEEVIEDPASSEGKSTEDVCMELTSKKNEKRRSILKKKSESLKRGLAAVSNSNSTWWNKRYASDYENDNSRLTTAYLRDLKVHRHSLTYRGAMLNIGRYRLRASSCPDIYRNSMTLPEKEEWYAGLIGLWDAIADMMNFSYFVNINFLLFAISNFLLYTWYDVPYVYVADYAVELGISKTDSIYIISFIGILNMLGEIAYGWAGDRSWLNPKLIYAISMILCGMFVAVIPMLTAYEHICIVSGGFGLLISANYSLTSILLVESISLEKFTNAYGLLLLVQGVANLVGPPLAGWLCERTGNFSMSFYLAGFFISLSGCLLEVTELTALFDKFKTTRKYQESNGISDCRNSDNILNSKVVSCNNQNTYIP